MSLAEAMLAIDGFMEMNSAQSGAGANSTPPTPEEAQALFDEIERKQHGNDA